MMKEITNLYKTDYSKPTKNSCLKRLREKRQNDVKTNAEENRKFWNDIWFQNLEHNESAEWISEKVSEKRK